MRNIHKIGENIYITSDEEIKEGVDQWYLDKVLNEPYNSGGAQYSSKQDIIILTTDFKLIKDGVQAIDDDFLEWFVKNPNCEEVDINRDWGYPKIIIPEEEPLYDYGWCKGNVILPKEKATLKLPSLPYEYEPKITNCGNNNCQSGVINGINPKLCRKCNPKEEPKQESLEEIAKRLYPYEIGYGKPKPIIQYLHSGSWLDFPEQSEVRIKPTPDYSKEIEALQAKAKENGMSVIIKFEKL